MTIPTRSFDSSFKSNYSNSSIIFDFCLFNFPPEFSSDHCAPAGVSNDVEFTSFNRICYEFNVAKGTSFDFAREKCKKNNGDLIHGFKGVTTSFILAELERRKEKLKTQLVWIGAQKEPGVVVKTWKWVDGKVPTF